MAVRIGELLLKEKRITPAQLQEALNYQKGQRGQARVRPRQAWLRQGRGHHHAPQQAVRRSVDQPHAVRDRPAVIKLIPPDTAQKYLIVPLSRSGATLTIAMTDPTNVFAIDDIKFMTGYNVEPVVAAETAVLEAIVRYYAAPTGRGPGAGGRRRGGRLDVERDHARHGHEGARGDARSTTTSRCSRSWSRSTSPRSSGRGARRRSSGW